MSKSSAIPVQNLSSPVVPEAVNQKDLEALPKNNVPFISTFQRKRVLENRLHFLYERYRDKLSVTNAMREYQDHRHRKLTVAAATSLGLLGANEMSRIFRRSPVFRYSLMNPVPLVLTAAVPFLLATESSTNFLEKHTGNLWRIHKSRVNQSLPDKTYKTSGLYSDKLVDHAFENPNEIMQTSFQELITGHNYEVKWQNMFMRGNKDFEDYPVDIRMASKEMKLEFDIPERLKRFDPHDKDVQFEMEMDDPLNYEDQDQFFDATGDDMSPQFNDELPAVDHGFDEEAFIDLPINSQNMPLVINTTGDVAKLDSKNHAPLWLNKLIPTHFRTPEAYEALSRNWRQKMGLERIKQQHTFEMQQGRTDVLGMQDEVQQYIEKCKDEDFLTRVKDIKMRPRDATSNLSKRRLITITKEDDKKFFEYEKFLEQLHQDWKKKPTMMTSYRYPVEHIPGTYLDERGTWIHEIEGTKLDVKQIPEEVWRNHYEAMIDVQSRYDIASNVLAYDYDHPRRVGERVRLQYNTGNYYEKGLQDELEKIDIQKLEREGRLEEFYDAIGMNEEDEEEAEEKKLAFDLTYQPLQLMKEDLVQNLEITSPLLFPEYYLNSFQKNLLKMDPSLMRQLMMLELEEPGVNPEYVDKFIKEDLPQSKEQFTNQEGEFKRMFDNYQPNDEFLHIDDVDEYVQTLSHNFGTSVAVTAFYGYDITAHELYDAQKEPSEEEEEEGEKEEGEEDDQEEEEEEPFQLPPIYTAKEQEKMEFTLDIIRQANAYEQFPNSDKAGFLYLFGLSQKDGYNQNLSFSEKDKSDYRYVDDVIDAYQPWNRDHRDLILDSLPKHVFMDIKKPLNFNKRPYETNEYNPFRGKVYEDFWGFLRYDDYRTEMINKRNLAPQMAFWRRDY